MHDEDSMDLSGNETNEQVMHEEGGFRAWTVLLIGLGMLGLVALAMVVAYFALGVTSDDGGTPVPVTDNMRNEPLMFDPTSRSNQHLLREEQERLRREYLNSYGWVNEEKGIVHIPISRAIELLVEQGALPTFEEESELSEDTRSDVPP
jgi:hypothetical protein